jgi:hypothetical protein
MKSKMRAKARQPISFAAGVGRALRRAAKDAQKTARMYGTPLYVALTCNRREIHRDLHRAGLAML